MTTLLSFAKGRLAPSGFKKKAATFMRSINGYHQVVNFQRCSFADGVYINLGVYQNGLPILPITANALIISDAPKEYECTIRQRAERVCNAPRVGRARDSEIVMGVYPDVIPDDALPLFEDFFSIAIPGWLDSWSSDDRMVNADDKELSSMFPCVPILWPACLAMVKCYCSIRLGRIPESKTFLERFTDVSGGKYSMIHDYLNAKIHEILITGAPQSTP